ncbi:MAG: hypothetical protein SGCHY_003376 [Lobulomycetales sp.]
MSQKADGDAVKKLMDAYKQLSYADTRAFRHQLNSLRNPMTRYVPTLVADPMRHASVCFSIPRDVLLAYVLPRLDLSIIITLARLNKAWNQLVESPTLWHNLCARDHVNFSSGGTLQRDGILTGSMSRQHNAWKQAYISHFAMLRNWSRVFHLVSVTSLRDQGTPRAINIISSQGSGAIYSILLPTASTRNSASLCLIAGCKDKRIRIWSVSGDSTSLLVASSPEILVGGHIGSVLCLSHYPLNYDGPGWSFVSGSSDGNVLVWNASRPVMLLSGHSESVLSVAVVPDGRIVSSSKDGTIRLWTITSPTPKLPGPASTYQVVTLGTHEAAVNSIAYVPPASSDSTGSSGYIVSGSGDRSVLAWPLPPLTSPRPSSGGDPAGSTEGRLVGSHDRGVACVAFDAKRRRVASGSSDASICIWNFEDATLIARLRGHLDLVRSVQFNDAGVLVSGGYDGVIKVWDVEEKKLKFDLVGCHCRVFKVAFDDRRIVACGQDGRILMFEFAL